MKWLTIGREGGGGGGGLFISLAAMHALEIRVISWHVNSRPSSWLPDSRAVTHSPVLITDMRVRVCVCVCVCPCALQCVRILDVTENGFKGQWHLYLCVPICVGYVTVDVI